MTDPRSSIKALLDAEITDANLTKDDDATELSWHIIFAPYTIQLERLFLDKGNDLVFTVADADPCSTRLGVAHVGSYKVTPHAIDKYNDSGSRIITATLILWKAVEELRAVFLANPWGSMRSLTEDRIEVHNLGDVQVWSKPCTIEYKTYSR